MSHTSFHLKYRPRTLEKVVGHSKIVTELKGMIASKKFPNALLFTGPSSAGKTTMARAFAASAEGVDTVEGAPDFYEVNAADNRSIDDVRRIVDMSKLRPMRFKHRYILLDEVHQLVSLQASVNCFAGETLVHTEHGPMTIRAIHEKIQAGHEIRVTSYNHTTGEIELKRVQASRRVRNTKSCVRIGNVVCTHDHPWWDPSKDLYVAARDIRVVFKVRL